MEARSAAGHLVHATAIGPEPGSLDVRTRYVAASRTRGSRVSYESQVEPIKLGYLFDFKLPDGFPQEQRDDLTRPFQLVFADGLEQGLLDRPVEIVFREVEGLPKGSVKAVIDAYAELVDEGCLAVFGPAITDNAVPDPRGDRAAVPAADDQRLRGRGMAGRVDVRAAAGVDDRRADLLGQAARRARAHRGRCAHRAVAHRRVATSRNFRKACRRERASASWRRSDRPDRAGRRRRGAAGARRGAAAIVHCGFGFGVVQVNPALRELGWDPPRFMGTAFRTRGSTR